MASSHKLVDEFGRRATCYYAIRAAQADGPIDSEESATIRRMADKAGLSDELVAQTFALVEAEDRLKGLRRLLMLPENPPY